MSWWSSLLPNVKPDRKVTAAIILSGLICGVGMVWVWQSEPSDDKQITRLGQALSQTLAHTSAGELLHGNRIELTVIATDVVRLPEVAGVVFYNAKNEILAVNGSTDQGDHFTAPATLDDTITGYVSVVLLPEAFANDIPWSRWLVSLVILLTGPIAAWLLLVGVNRGQQSLPIVSVPEPEPQRSYCVAITLHNQMALGRADMEQAVADALTMAHEAGARHDALCLAAKPRGVLMLFDAVSGADQALQCARLTLALLGEFETRGDFRAAMSHLQITGSVAEQGDLETKSLDPGIIDTLFTLAALSKRDAVLVANSVFMQLSDDQQQLSARFTHPLAEDLATSSIYEVRQLTDTAQTWVEEQAALILGFTQTDLHRRA